MSSLAAAPVLGAFVTDAAGTAPALLVVLSGGLVGMSIREMIGILGDDDDGDAADDGMADGGGLMAEAGDAEELGGLGGLDGGEDDEFGDFDGDDAFGDVGEGGADTDELEHRLDELETEVGSLSSTVNTVRNENEQISESVEEVEENVRKLLDIYEMVTRGVNPFADDMEPGGMGGAGGGSFGLFDDDGGDDREGDLDDEVANADAEGFFDEDLVEEESSPTGDVGDVMGGGPVDGAADGFDDGGGTFDEAALDQGDGDLDGFDDVELDDDFAEDVDGGVESSATGDGDGDGESGKSFAELKDEYETGEADWADDVGGDGGVADELGDAADVLEDDGDDLLEEAGDAADGGGDGDGDDALADDELFDEVIDEAPDGAAAEIDDREPANPAPETPDQGPDQDPDRDPDLEPAQDPDSQSTTDAESESDPATASGDESESGGGPDTEAGPESGVRPDADGESAAGDGKPYLATMPEGFAAELVVVEWLEFLVGDVGVRETARAIDYYERIDWIAPPVADELQTYLRGFDAVDGGDGGLTIDHHTRSLRYVSQLDGGAADAFVGADLLGHRGGGADGIQR